MITFHAYTEMYRRAKDFDSMERYILQRRWHAWMEGMTAGEVTDLMEKIYRISCHGIMGVLEIEGCKLAELCRRYLLPYPSVQEWRAGGTQPPEYVLLLLGWAVISQ